MGTEVKEDVVWERLRSENSEFQRWEQEHSKLEENLSQFTSHRHLTPEEEAEEKRIKKLKLIAKDRMMALVRQHGVGSA